MAKTTVAQTAHQTMREQSSRTNREVVAPCRSCYGAGVVLDIEEEVLGYT